MKKFFSKEAGQSLVMVALALSLIMGCAALAIDKGKEHDSQIDLQNAADAAALAATNGFPDSAKIEQEARKYAQKNCPGVVVKSVTWPYNGDNQLVEVVVEQKVEYGMAKAIGSDSKIVTARAVAKKEAGAGGVPTDLEGDLIGSDCYKSPTAYFTQQYQEWPRNDYVYVLQCNGHHDSTSAAGGDGHTAHYQALVLRFNKPVEHKECAWEVTDYYHYMDDPRVMVYEYGNAANPTKGYWQNATDNIGLASIKVYAQAGLQIESFAVVCRGNSLAAFDPAVVFPHTSKKIIKLVE